MKKVLSLILVALMATLALGTTALADDDDKFITTTGKATIQIAPDMAIVSLGVRETAEEVITAQGNANIKINAVIDALIANGVERKDIATNYMSIYTEYRYDYQTGEQTFIGYTADNHLSIKVRDVNQAGALIDEALKAGANQLNNLNFTRENNSGAVDRALELAVEDASRKADVIAKATGVRLGGVIKAVEDVTYQYEGEYPLNRLVGNEDGSGGDTQVQAGMLGVSMTVVVTFQIVD